MSIDRGYGIATSAVLADSYDLDALIADTEAAKVAALAAQVAAETAETNAETAETNAETAETNAAASASAAATSESNIAGSEAVCAASETAAAASASAAATSETNASTSETNALSYKNTAVTSATNAAASETAAASSETSAASSASTANTQAATATTQATNAANSATSASNSATSASTSATNASTSASSASTSATAASSSASNASTSASQASTSASSASGSATAASTSATNASTSETNAATSATNAATSLSNFEAQYESSATAPSSPVEGALWFDTSTDIMKVYSGSAWQSAGSSVNGTSERNVYTATASQTTFNATYDSGFVDVYLNGVKLQETVDFTATNGSTVVLTSGANSGDIVDIVAYGTFELADHYTKVASDARYLQPTGDGSQLTGIDALPDQTGHSGKYLNTDGTDASWSEITGGGPSLGTDSIIRTNAQTISENITIPVDTNGMSIGDITIADTYTVTVNGRWVII